MSGEGRTQVRLGTHLLAGWAVANGVELVPGVRLDARGRRLAVVASLAPFLDGLPALWGNEQLFQKVHHDYTCSLPVGVLVVLLLLPFGTRGYRLSTALASAAGFALNATSDLVTTNWPVKLFWPLSDWSWAVHPHLSNFVIYLVIGTACDLAFTGAAAAVYWRWRRTPFELFGERFDAVAIDFVRLPWRHRCRECGRRATYRCRGCGTTVCGYHVRLAGLRPYCLPCSKRLDGAKPNRKGPSTG